VWDLRRYRDLPQRFDSLVHHSMYADWLATGRILTTAMTPGSPTGDSHGTLVTDVLPFSYEQFRSLPGVTDRGQRSNNAVAPRVARTLAPRRGKNVEKYARNLASAHARRHGMGHRRGGSDPHPHRGSRSPLGPAAQSSGDKRKGEA